MTTIVCVQTHEDEDWTYGERREDGVVLSCWIKAKTYPSHRSARCSPPMGKPKRPTNPNTAYLAAAGRWPIKPEYVGTYWVD